MSTRTGKGNQGAARGASMSIAEKLKARGLGIKYSKLKQNAHDPHSAPYRQPSAKEDYKDPIKDFRVYPANEEPDQDIGMFIRLHTTVHTPRLPTR